MASSNAITAALRCTLLAAWVLAAHAHAQPLPSTAAVQVEFARPEAFSDVGHAYDADRTRQAYFEELSRHLARQATRLLPPGQRLNIVITDLDMAGGYELWRRGAGDVRIVRDVYPARIALAFKLASADGAVMRQGERMLRDPFLVPPTIYRSDPLRYEKALLDQWLEREFAAAGT